MYLLLMPVAAPNNRIYMLSSTLRLANPQVAWATYHRRTQRQYARLSLPLLTGTSGYQALVSSLAVIHLLHHRTHPDSAAPTVSIHGRSAHYSALQNPSQQLWDSPPHPPTFTDRHFQFLHHDSESDRGQVRVDSVRLHRRRWRNSRIGRCCSVRWHLVRRSRRDAHPGSGPSDSPRTLRSRLVCSKLATGSPTCQRSASRVRVPANADLRVPLTTCAFVGLGGTLIGNPKYDWGFASVPQKHANGRVLPQTRYVMCSAVLIVYLLTACSLIVARDLEDRPW